MHALRISAVLSLGLALASQCAAATAFTLKSLDVELPDSDRQFPPGPGAAVINANCLACHSADMVLNQPALSKTAWTAEVTKMIKVYKAPIAAQDIGPIIDYLTRLSAGK